LSQKDIYQKVWKKELVFQIIYFLRKVKNGQTNFKITQSTPIITRRLYKKLKRKRKIKKKIRESGSLNLSTLSTTSAKEEQI
jgi:hypothetical protein